MALLLAGGCRDYNIAALADAAKKNGIETIDLRLPISESPVFCWNPGQRRVQLSGCDVHATCGFIRYDVFATLKDSRPEVAVRSIAWYQAVWGWLLSDPSIRIFNREMSQVTTNKPATLVRALHAGLKIPWTLITNDARTFSAEETASMVAKPVAGGDYCYSLEEAVAKANLGAVPAASPAIVQNRLAAPEVRVYVIGKHTFAFQLLSNSLDYRVHQDVELKLMPEPPDEVTALRKLTFALRVDFGAADFKTDPNSGELVFLELNTSPMFESFDAAADGRICSAILDELTQPESPVQL